jgi:hypothetical protein
MPILWFEQVVLMEESMTDEIKWAMFVPDLGYICCGLIITIGIMLIFWMPLNVLIRNCRPMRSHPIKGHAPLSVLDKMDVAKNGDMERYHPEGSPLLTQKTIEMKPMNGQLSSDKLDKR